MFVNSNVRKPILTSAAVLSLGLIAQYAMAAEISVNFTGGSSGTVDSSGPAGASGAAQQGDWNNIAPGANTYGSSTGSTGALTNSTGTKTDVVISDNGVTAFSGGEYATTSTASGSGTLEDRQLFQAFDNYYSYPTYGYPTGAFTISNVPYAQYSVYVYMSGDTGIPVAATDGTSTFYYETPTYSGATFPGFTQDTSTSLGSPTINADYVIFSESASSVTLSFTPSDGSNSADVNIYGIQIVQAPEPTGLALAGAVAGAAMLRRRRRTLR